MKFAVKNRSTWVKTCTGATLSTTNPTWTVPASNPVLRGGRSAANRLSQGTAEKEVFVIICYDDKTAAF
jgi:hypothetical protein